MSSDNLNEDIDMIDMIDMGDAIEPEVQEENTTDKDLIIFLRDLADAIENEKIEDTNKQLVGEFYMKYKFSTTSKKLFENMDEEDIHKFFFLGWFIYCVILKDKRFKSLSAI
jgi:hypothetical protein